MGFYVEPKREEGPKDQWVRRLGAQIEGPGLPRDVGEALVLEITNSESWTGLLLVVSEAQLGVILRSREAWDDRRQYRWWHVSREALRGRIRGWGIARRALIAEDRRRGLKK